MSNDKLKDLIIKTTTLKDEGKYVEAIEAAHLLLKNSAKVQDYSAMLAAHLTNAESFYFIGDMEEALNNIEAHSELCLLHGDETEWMNSYNIRFLLHAYNKEYDQAKITLRKSIELGKKLKHYNIVSKGFSNCSTVMHTLGNFEEALKNAKLGLKYAKMHEPHCPLMELRASLNSANAYIDLQQLARSKRLIDEMWSIELLNEYDREKAQLYVLQARWHEARNEYQEAFDAYSAASTIIKLYEDLVFLKDVQKKRLELADSLVGINKGFLLQKEYIDLVHSLEEQALVKKGLQLDIRLKLADLQNKANTDYLTGLYNRSFIEQTTNLWLHGNRKDDLSITCITFDIDNLKIVNDKHGHLMGDEIIKQVARVCSEVTRKDDLLGRFGGDEFILVMHGASIEIGQRKAQELFNAIQNIRIKTAFETLTVTVSMGISNNRTSNVKDFKELFHIADLALYEAKKNGKNQITQTS